MNAKELTIEVRRLSDMVQELKHQTDYLTQEFEKLRMHLEDLRVDVKMIEGRKGNNG